MENQTKEVIVRVLNSSDSLSYRKLRLESLKMNPESYVSDYETEVKTPRLLFENFMEKRDLQNIMLGAFFDDRPIGLCGLISEGDSLRVVQMYVNKDFQKIGVGLKLLSMAKTFPVEINKKSLILTVYEDNKAAFDLYNKSSFKITSKGGGEIHMEYSNDRSHGKNKNR